MKKWVKRILLTLGTIFILLLAAAVLIPILFKDKIEAAVKAEVNKSLNATVNWGAWDITILRSFPNLTVEIADVSVLNAAPFEGVELARIAGLIATVDVKSLFGDKIEVKRIQLVKPNIHVKVLEDGRANWDIAKPDTAQAAEVEPADTASAFHLGLSEFSITDGRLIYDDASLTFSMDLFGLDLTGSGDMTESLYTLKTVLHADTANVSFDGVKYLRHVKADITADLDMDMPNMKFTFRENEATINQLVLGFDGWLAMPGDPIDMDITWNAKKTDFGTLLSLVPAEFATDLSGVQMSGKAGFSGHVKGSMSDESMPGFGVAMDVDQGRFKYPDLPAAVEDIYIDLKVNSPGGKDLDGMVVDLKRFAMKMAGNPVEARMHLTHPISDPNVDAELKADLDLASVKKVVPMEGDELQGKLAADVRMKGAMSDVEAQRYEEFQADGRVTLAGMNYASDSLPYAVGIKALQFDFSPRFLALTSFTGSLGSSNLQANGRMDNYIQWWLRDSTLMGSFDLVADKFDLNELMGPSDSPEAESAPADSTPMSVIEVPGNIDFRMGLKAGEVIYDQMKLTNVRGGMHVHDQRVDLKDVFFNLFNGSVVMSGGYEARDVQKPSIDFRYDIKDLDIQQTVAYVDLVQKVAPIAKTCKGSFSTRLDMKGRLNERMEADLNSLTGDGTLVTRNVQVDGFQPLVDLAKALKVKEIENTKLQDVSFSYEFRDGRMEVKPFKVKIDRIQSEVKGSTGFAQQDIDYDMKARVPTDIFGSNAATAVGGLLGKANAAIGSNLQVPKELDATIKFTGTVTKPIVKPVFAGGTTSVKDAVVTEVKEEINTQINKAKEEAIARAKEERDKLIAKAQAEADKLKADARREAAAAKAQAYKAADDELAKVSNPLAKAAARLVADKAKQEADKVEQRAIAEADKRADAIVEAARKQGDELVRKAEATDTTVK
ncbi:MAG: AsmA family protein [Flavobacteriales bacterium]|nr:AsmA family protein [Flavobacteriales bacterium]